MVTWQVPVATTVAVVVVLSVVVVVVVGYGLVAVVVVRVWRRRWMTWPWFVLVTACWLWYGWWCDRRWCCWEWGWVIGTDAGVGGCVVVVVVVAGGRYGLV